MASNAESTTARPKFEDLNLPEPTDWTSWLQQWGLKLLMYAAENPWSFIYTVFLCLSPLFLVSGVCAYKLAKDIEQRDKEKKKKAKRDANIAKTRRHAKDD